MSEKTPGELEILKAVRELPRSGSLELKTIRGHKYLYLRYWEGKRHKSQYLGKWLGDTPAEGCALDEEGRT